MNSPGGRGHKKKPVTPTASPGPGPPAPPSRSESPVQGAPPSPHKRNLFVFSYPLLAAFSLLRFIAFQLGLLFAWCCDRLSRRVMADKKLRDLSASPDRPQEPDVVRSYHQQAFQHISMALRIDEQEKDQKEQAIECYKKGIQELEKGIAVQVIGQGEQYVRARRLQAKMMTNLIMAKDRLQLLATLQVDMQGQNKPMEVCSESTNLPCRNGHLKPEKGAVPKKKDPVSVTSNPLPRAKVTPKAMSPGISSAPRIPNCTTSSFNRQTGLNPSAPRGAGVKHGKPNNKPTTPTTGLRKKDMKNLKNVDSNLANLILNEVVDSCWQEMENTGAIQFMGDSQDDIGIEDLVLAQAPADKRLLLPPAAPAITIFSDDRPSLMGGVVSLTHAC
ncbi:unnamed protein product [Ranitomeya imitator]|uniref:MIT domain-containing protein n=1 Tax=Ranitomeya imitator TaxID=111125 RepID=A0ABN9LA82_9NEOB|nr:unnamed protein product [Ranitomeya imitator]